MTSIAKIVNPKIAGMSFRLIDFCVYDKNLDSNNDEDVEGGDASHIDSSFIIQMFGISEKGETCSIHVTDYNPFFYVSVPDNWKEGHASELLKALKRETKVAYYKNCILDAELVEHNKLYGFTGGKKSKFVKLSFKNMASMNKVKNLWYTYDAHKNKKLTPYVISINGKKTTMEIYESNIPPLLRYFHINNISPSGWVFIPTFCVKVPTTKTTTCNYEYICKKTQIRSLPNKETRVPYKICSFDIEASSSHGDFPVPVKTYKLLAMNIVDVFKKQMDILDKSQYPRLLERILLTAFGYDRIDDIEVVYPKVPVSKERVVHLFQKLIKTPIKDDKMLRQVVEEKLSIEKMFHDSFLKQHEVGCGDGDEDDGGGYGGGEAREYENGTKYSKKSGAASKSKKNNEHNIIDLIISNDLDRDEKIILIDAVLSSDNNSFPKLEGDKVTFIGSTFMTYGSTEPYLNHCVVLGTCDPVEGAIIETAETESDLLLQWMTLIQNENPDIIIGYNIFGFDYEFIFQRAKENEILDEFMKFSRIENELSYVQESYNAGNGGICPEKLENTKVVLASGEYDLRYFRMTGRLQIDMYTYFRRDFNLSSYKLDDVAGQYISDDVCKIVHNEDDAGNETTELYSRNLMGLNIGDFIHIEITEFTTDYYNDGQKFKVVNIKPNVEVREVVKGKEVLNKYNIIVVEGRHEIVSKKSIKWGMAKDNVSPQDIFRLSFGSSADRAIVAKYCIQDCNLVHHLMNKIDVITGYIEMSRICSVPISYLVFRGQGIKLTSYVAKKCREKNTLMPDLEKSYENDGYEGAIVLPPKCSMYMDNPVACVDYSSLYPSSMISQNYSHDSKVWTKEYDNDGNLIRETGEKNEEDVYIYDNLPDYTYIHIEFDNFKYLRDPSKPSAKAVKTKVGKIVCCWAQLPDNQKSIMPSILEELLKARSDTRKMIKTESDPFMQNILDKRQLGYKVTANSLYGQCGARTSTFYEKDVAASTTATGRMMITYAKEMIEKVYQMEYETECHGVVKCNAEYIYGDTDSVFFTFNLQDPSTGAKIVGKKALEITIEIAQDAAQLCTQFLKPPMELSYEKTLMPFILLSKKRYVGMLYETDPNKGKLKYMGLSLKRRDSCDYLKDTYGGILNILMHEQNINKAIQFLDQSLENLISGNVSMDKLAITRALRSHYKNPGQIAHSVLANRIGKRDPGNKPKSGDRIKYLFITHPNNNVILGEKIETPEFILENKLEIDYMYYITNQLMKPLQQLFGLSIEHIWRELGKGSAILTFKKDMAKLKAETEDLEEFMKKKEKYCSLKIKILLFDKFLTKIFNSRNKIQTIDSIFKKK
jgi:DNA polymerase elongation subunit (family B)